MKEHCKGLTIHISSSYFYDLFLQVPFKTIENMEYEAQWLTLRYDIIFSPFLSPNVARVML